MKIFLITILLFLLISSFVYRNFFINKIGGNFSKNKELSKEAKQMIKEAFKGINKKKFIDCHVHILGVDKKNTGCFVNPNMQNFFKAPIEYIKYKIYLSSSGIKKIKGQTIDKQYIVRLNKLIKNFNPEGNFYILAMDKFYYSNGKVDLKKTQFYVPNEYIYRLSKIYKNLIPIISINPYKKTALKELEKWGNLKIKYMKWLPNTMGINPGDKNLISFYKIMKKYNITLLTHTGKEEAVESSESQELGNPLLLRLPLSMGIKVIAAHCASSGKSIDLDSPEKNLVSNFELFLRMMDEKKYEGLLFGDISGLTQYNRMDECLEKILNRKDLHKRLINGSDYPLPGINFLIRTKKLYKKGFITKSQKKILNEIYKKNPLMFDFVLKRIIRSPKTKNKF